MEQHDRLRLRTQQHKPKNAKSRLDDKDIYKAMQLVQEYISQRFDIQNKPEYTLAFERSITVGFMQEYIRHKGCRDASDMEDRFIAQCIIPDGGVLYLVKQEPAGPMKKPLVIAEVKRQGTNDERAREGKAAQAQGNAIERLGKNLTGIRAMMNHERITPFVCFGWGCDFAEGSNTVLSKVSMLNEFYPLNKIYVNKRDGSSDFNRFAPVSMFFREQRWTVEEMFNVMKEIAETAFRYYEF